jgi:hypothetical protein
MNSTMPSSLAHQTIESQKSQLLSVMVGVYARKLTGTLQCSSPLEDPGLLSALAPKHTDDTAFI